MQTRDENLTFQNNCLTLKVGDPHPRHDSQNYIARKKLGVRFLAFFARSGALDVDEESGQVRVNDWTALKTDVGDSPQLKQHTSAAKAWFLLIKLLRHD
jgi:hypothetical protein